MPQIVQHVRLHMQVIINNRSSLIITHHTMPVLLPSVCLCVDIWACMYACLCLCVCIDLNHKKYAVYPHSYFMTDPSESVVSVQQGVFRTNCIDCLDRTNVVQSMLAQRSLQEQLQVCVMLLPFHTQHE